jgi:hypothetical protein
MPFGITHHDRKLTWSRETKASADQLVEHGVLDGNRRSSRRHRLKPLPACWLRCLILPLSSLAQQSGSAAVNRAPDQPATFVDITAASGVHFVHQAPHTAKKYLIETMGSGVALFDCDGDGRLGTC